MSDIIVKKEHVKESVLDSDCPEELVEYVDFVLSISGVGTLYGLDKMRQELHIAMAAKYGLTEQETQFVCELDSAIRFCGGDLNAVCNGLHRRLCAMRNKKVIEVKGATNG